MIEFKTIAYEQNGPILVIMFNRPEVMNALSPQLMAELRIAVEAAAEEETVKVVIVTGAGKAWSAGVDLKAINEGVVDGKIDLGQMKGDGDTVIHLLQTMPKPTIAVLNGYCYTGALELMMAFDIVIAAEEAAIGDTHSKWGILPKWGMSQRLSQLVGPMKAREMSFTCEPITGKEAAKIGLVNKAVPSEELDETVAKMVKQILGNSSQTIAAFKHLYHTGEQSTLKKGIESESK